MIVTFYAALLFLSLSVLLLFAHLIHRHSVLNVNKLYIFRVGATFRKPSYDQSAPRGSLEVAQYKSQENSSAVEQCHLHR